MRIDQSMGISPKYSYNKMEEILFEDGNFKVLLLNKAKHFVSIQWQYKSSENIKHLFRLKKKEFKNWKTIFWGKEKNYFFGNLEQNNCLSLTLERIVLNGSKPITTSSCSFKTSTLPDIPTVTSFFRAVKKGHIINLRKMISLKPDLIHIYTNNGQTPLALAATVSSDDEETCRILLEAGANIYNGCKFTKKTPLHIAIYNGNLNIAKYLLDKKSNIHSVDGIGLTVAHYAVDSNNLEALKLCFKYGADVEAQDQCGYSLIQRAIVMDADIRIIKFLMGCNCNLHVVNKNQLNCVDLAKIYLRDNILKILEPPKKRLLAARRSVKHRHLFSSVISLIKCANN